MLRFFASLVALLALTGCVVLAEPTAPESTELLTFEPGLDAVSLDALIAIPGATVRYDDAARLVYRGEAPATIEIRFDAGPAWRMISPATLSMQPGANVPISIEITLGEGETQPGDASLGADVLASPPLPLPTP